MAKVDLIHAASSGSALHHHDKAGASGLQLPLLLCLSSGCSHGISLVVLFSRRCIGPGLRRTCFRQTVTALVSSQPELQVLSS